MIERMEAEETNLKALPEAKDQNSHIPSMIQVWQQQLERLKSQPPSGRVVIRISKDVDRWRNTQSDIEVRAGDLITVPKRPGIVLIQGQVYNPSAVTYSPGKDAGWYLRQAGGITEVGNKKAAFVVRADGSVVSSGSGGWWGGDVLGTTLHPGDAVYVPEKLPKARTTWRTLLEAAQLASTVGVVVSVATR
ncbi:MAG: hypothetical protein ACRD2R_07755 [Terriglobales bacterium]